MKLKTIVLLLFVSSVCFGQVTFSGVGLKTIASFNADTANLLQKTDTSTLNAKSLTLAQLAYYLTKASNFFKNICFYTQIVVIL